LLSCGLLLTPGQLPLRVFQLLAGALQFLSQGLLAAFVLLDFLSERLHLARIQRDVSAHAGGLAIPSQRLDRVLLYAQSLFEQKTIVELRPRVSLFGGLAIPVRGLGVIRRCTQAFVIDLAHIGLRGLVPGLGERQPDLEGGGVIAAVVGHVLAAADGAIDPRGLDRLAWSHEGHHLSEPADLAREQTIDDQKVIGVACRRGRSARGGRRALLDAFRARLEQDAQDQASQYGLPVEYVGFGTSCGCI